MRIVARNEFNAAFKEVRCHEDVSREPVKPSNDEHGTSAARMCQGR